VNLGRAKEQRKSQAILQKERNTPKETDEMKSLFNFKMTTPALVSIFPLVFLALSPIAQGVVPPPDGGYPGGNTAQGQNALLSLTSGINNTAVGWFSLKSNTDGQLNTAVGAGTLFNAVHANRNTAIGGAALFSDTSGESNTAVGALALFHNTTAFYNTAVGDSALLSNTTGGGNAALGFEALRFNIAGFSNTAIGSGTLTFNQTGHSNTAVGTAALQNNLGSNNTALGRGAGGNVRTADHVIAIGHAAADVSFSAWIGSVYGVTTQSGTTAPVIVSDSGQLGTIASSERFKTNINAMEKASEVILSLRPVTFHYKRDAKGTPQFGLIAEEVAKIDPALVLPDKEGKPYTVRYDAVNAMLLNEFLKEHRRVQHLEKQVDALTAGLQKVSAQLELSNPAPQTVLNGH
jgi:Chaperone of endosialidase